MSLDYKFFGCISWLCLRVHLLMEIKCYKSHTGIRILMQVAYKFTSKDVSKFLCRHSVAHCIAE